MTWYAAHVILYIVFKEGQQDSYPVWENVFIVEGADEETARTRLRTSGVRAKATPTGV
jgi:hypothetical protein